ncbi:hypothetical protein BIW11_03908 [Tropilaelaps mercedesae]|uniref:Uncharacterized protein n=1 Tax=Tropilaelaps mercedesae TaxID=418985 RepID=A0A1V9XDW8_9ACAR|nr:hypothetical protein BIW11_03908 [Tropilaelaps mercedesae]
MSSGVGGFAFAGQQQKLRMVGPGESEILRSPIFEVKLLLFKFDLSMPFQLL